MSVTEFTIKALLLLVGLPAFVAWIVASHVAKRKEGSRE